MLCGYVLVPLLLKVIILNVSIFTSLVVPMFPILDINYLQNSLSFILLNNNIFIHGRKIGII